MSILLFLLLSAAIPCCHARHHFKRPFFRKTPVRMLRKVNWKHIAAGGAAVGTVVAAYKVSNGIEDGLRESAKEAPKSFVGIVLTILTLPVTAVVWYLGKHFKERKIEK